MVSRFSGLYNEEALSLYIDEIKKFPILGQDEEYELATKWKEKGDKRAMEKLIKSHLRLVTKIARGYSGYGLSQADLIAEGNIGIMHALQHFDPNVGYRFSTYAIWWIKAKIKDFIYNSWSIVKLASSKDNRKLFFGLNKLKRTLGIDKVSEDNAKLVAEKMKVAEEDVITSENRFSNRDFSVNTPMGEENKSSFQDFIVDMSESQEEQMLQRQEYEYRKKILHEALNTLSRREYEIVSAYRLRTPTKSLREISKEMNISAERVRQIEHAAFLKLQKHIRNVEWNAIPNASGETDGGIYQTIAKCFLNVVCVARYVCSSALF
ncbi:MAG: RNA polymerase factor sigma-32 [Alphaproteobacteria bacterium]|nr:RNA polymerase factor sigma-32 [Alphaproteobacteria bacterium]